LFLSCVKSKASRRQRRLHSAFHAVSHRKRNRLHHSKYLITCRGNVGRKTERSNDAVLNFDLQCFNGLPLGRISTRRRSIFKNYDWTEITVSFCLIIMESDSVIHSRARGGQLLKWWRVFWWRGWGSDRPCKSFVREREK
jgi:hypothetical protein